MLTKSSRGLGCLFLFALPFAAAGLFVGYLASRSLVTWYEARDWVETPAHILQADLEVNQGSDSTTYQVTARYEYRWGNQTHTSERVGLSGGSDNVGSFHQDRHAELSRYQGSGESFRCFVDPDDPTEAILYREMRWGLFALMGVFSLLFTGAGVGIMAAGLWGKRKVVEQEQLEAQHPEAPWKWKSDWSDGRIRTSGSVQFLFPLIFALFWNLISMPLLFLLPREVLENGNKLALIGLIFPVVGLGLIVWAARAFLHWKKFGDSVLEMSTFPGVVGGPLAGRILTSVDIQPISGFDLTLSSIHRVTTGSGKNRSTSERVQWQEMRHIDREALDYDPTRSSIPVAFDIPFEAEPTEERSADDETLWRLEVTAETAGIDYSAQFELPVFRTADSRPEVAAEESPWPAEEPQNVLVDLGRERIGKDWLSEGGFALSFAPARHKGAAWGLTLFTLLWTGFTALLIHLEAGLFFPIIWGLFNLLLKPELITVDGVMQLPTTAFLDNASTQRVAFARLTPERRQY
ncbi:MAG: DUF3592 domain-containing protein, partial [Nitrospirae bacterium]|nr:DUF3592 domain-containing protein [Nitrospirota bacterium]